MGARAAGLFYVTLLTVRHRVLLAWRAT